MHLPPPPPPSPPFIWWWWWWVEKEGCRTTAPECKQTGRTEITLLPLFIVVLRSCHSFGPSLASIKCSVLSPPYYEFTDKVDCFLLVSLLLTTFQQAKGEKKKHFCLNIFLVSCSEKPVKPVWLIRCWLCLGKWDFELTVRSCVKLEVGSPGLTTCHSLHFLSTGRPSPFICSRLLEL